MTKPGQLGHSALPADQGLLPFLFNAMARLPPGSGMGFVGQVIDSSNDVVQATCGVSAGTVGDIPGYATETSGSLIATGGEVFGSTGQVTGPLNDAADVLVQSSCWAVMSSADCSPPPL